MATRRTIADFKSKLVGGGARPNLFEVEITKPAKYLPHRHGMLVYFHSYVKQHHYLLQILQQLMSHSEVVFLKLQETGLLIHGL
jgi:hypothetical protein